jgi:hypothetical protein
MAESTIDEGQACAQPHRAKSCLSARAMVDESPVVRASPANAYQRLYRSRAFRTRERHCSRVCRRLAPSAVVARGGNGDSTLICQGTPFTAHARCGRRGRMSSLCLQHRKDAPWLVRNGETEQCKRLVCPCMVRLDGKLLALPALTPPASAKPMV